MISAERLKELHAYYDALAMRAGVMSLTERGTALRTAEALIELEAARTRIAELADDLVDAEACATVLRQQLTKLRAQGLSQEDRDACNAGAEAIVWGGQHDEEDVRNAAILRRLGGQTT